MKRELSEDKIGADGIGQKRIRVFKVKNEEICNGNDNAGGFMVIHRRSATVAYYSQFADFILCQK